MAVDDEDHRRDQRDDRVGPGGGPQGRGRHRERGGRGVRIHVAAGRQRFVARRGAAKLAKVEILKLGLS